MRPGDLFNVELEESAYDLVIIGHLCHLFEEERNRNILRRVFTALRPGGRVAIFDVLPEDQEDGVMVALYNISLFARTQEGQVYHFSSYADWLIEAGFDEIKRSPLAGKPITSLIQAKKPSLEA